MGINRDKARTPKRKWQEDDIRRRNRSQPAGWPPRDNQASRIDEMNQELPAWMRVEMFEDWDCPEDHED